MRARSAIALLLVLPATCGSSRAAEVEVAFPLGDAYRVGRYLPVRVSARDVTSGSVRIEADGAVPTRIDTETGRANRIVPLLSVTRIGAARWSSGTGAAASIAHALRPLADDEVLIGTTSIDESLAGELFPGKRVRWVTLDVPDPLPGPPFAWEALDAVLLDEAAAARVDRDHVHTLVAAGAAVAVRTDTPPDVRNTPWARRGRWWVSRVEVAGPNVALGPEAYEPAAAWAPGWPPSFPRGVMLVLVAFSLAAVGATLARWRRGWVVVVTLSGAAVAPLWWWTSAQMSSRAARGSIVVRGPQFTQTDEWSYHAPLVDRGHGYAPVTNAGITRPAFASGGHLRATEIHLLSRSDADRQPPFEFTLRRGQRIAFLQERFFLTPGPPPEHGYYPPASSSPFETLARGSYMTPGDRIAAYRFGTSGGRINARDEYWPDVVVDRPGYPPTPIPPAAASPAGLPK